MAQTRNAAFRVDVESEGLRRLVVDIKALEGGKVQVAALRKNLKATADPIVRQVKSNASWSKRIPGAVGTQVRFTAKKVGVSVFVSRKKAPHARPLENDGKSGTFKHPVFGKTKRRGKRYVTVEQKARPFFFNELARHIPDVEKAALKAIDDAARAAGFR